MNVLYIKFILFKLNGIFFMVEFKGLIFGVKLLKTVIYIVVGTLNHLIIKLL